MSDNENWRSANPDHLEHLADLLDASGRSRSMEDVASRLSEIFRDASELDASAELSRLRPLLTWLTETAPQLRENARLLRGDDPPLWSELLDSVNPFYDDGGTYALRVPGQEDANEFVQLANNEEWTEEDLREMADLLEQWDNNPAFAGYLVDEMGMEEYLRLAQRIDQAGTEGIGGEDLLTTLDTRMGNVLNASLQVPGQPRPLVGEDEEDMTPGSTAYQRWIATTAQGQRYQARLSALQALGGDRLIEPEPDTLMQENDPRLGYDVALELLESSTRPIDEQFFDQTMNHLMDLERTNPDIWSTDRYPVDDFTMTEDGWGPNPDAGWGPENDATDRLLGIGGNSNPDAVEAFFDPETNPGNLDYFIGEGEGVRYVTYGEGDFGAAVATSPGGYPGLNKALEAAATGYPPGTDPQQGDPGPSEANARIAEQTWNTFAAEYTSVPFAEEIEDSRLVEGGHFQSLRPAMGQIAATYIPSIQGAISGESLQPTGNPNPAFDSSGHTQMLLYELGKDPEIYHAVTAANNAYTFLTVDYAINGDHDSEYATPSQRVEWATDASGMVAGIMTDSRATAVYAEQTAEDGEFATTFDEAKQWADVAAATLGVVVGGGAGAALALGAAEVTRSIHGTFEADDTESAAAQYNRQYNESMAQHRDRVAEMAVRIAVSDQGLNFTADEVRDLVQGAHDGSQSGFLGGSLVGRGPLQEDQ
ncbi:hypothetical protein [Streptomyces sp. 6N223]|uniref:hypothetical protein n=1 Tax=Streptomyces sp. 6N223 TaxID=3457412 RepID=UPI003FD00EC2